MTKWILTSDSFSGNVTFYYDTNGLLVEFAVNSWDMARDQVEGFLLHLGFMLKDVLLTEFARKWRYRLNKEEVDLSFDRFYKFYGVMRDGFRAEPLWNKMSEKERYLTLLNVKAYKRFCRRNPDYVQMYPASYLRAHTKDDWDKLQNWKTVTK